MSVLIKNMEMPSRCYGCTFSGWSNLHQTMACKMYNFKPCFEDHSREYFEKRADFCPLSEQKIGHWVNTEPNYKSGFGNNAHYCSVCKGYYTTSPSEMHYCPNCGAKMEGELDEQ